MANTPADEEIIEKRPSNPVATACLVVGALATLAAITFQVAEVRDVRAKMGSERDSQAPWVTLPSKHMSEFKAALKKVIDDNDHAEITPESAAAGGLKAGEAGAGGAAPAAAPATEPEAKPEEPAAAPTEEKPEEPAPPADAGAPEKDSEKAAEGAVTEPPAAEGDAAKDKTETEPPAKE